MKTPLKIFRCRFLVLNKITNEIVSEQEISMLGKEGLPPTLQQQKRYVDHNRKLLEERGSTEAAIWEDWSKSLESSQKEAEAYGEPTGVISDSRLSRTATIGGFRANLEGNLVGQTSCIESILIDIAEFDEWVATR